MNILIHGIVSQNAEAIVPALTIRASGEGAFDTYLYGTWDSEGAPIDFSEIDVSSNSDWTTEGQINWSLSQNTGSAGLTTNISVLYTPDIPPETESIYFNISGVTKSTLECESLL